MKNKTSGNIKIPAKKIGKKLEEKFNLELDITDKSLIDFKKTKSISVASKISDLKSSKIGELYNVKPIHDSMEKLCLLKMQAKTDKSNVSIPKNINKEICTCLFEKNKSLSIAELETRVLNRIETPASTCITILDNYIEKHKGKKKSSGKSSRKSSGNKKNTRKHK